MSTDLNTQRSNSTGKIVQAILVVAILAMFFLAMKGLGALKKKPEIKKRRSPIMAVMATQATSDTVHLTVNVQGESRPRTEIDLVPEVAGKITYVSPKFLAGGLFKKGDVLYRIEDADYQVSIIKAGASVARAQQVLVREKAESEIARQDWADMGRGQASDLTLRKPQMLEAEANLQSANADLQNANLRLARTAVRAPFDGRVREKFADLGQYVNPGARLGRIFSTDVAEVRLALNDADLSRLTLPIAYVAKSRSTAPDVKLSATIGGKLRVWNGKIMRTDATYDPQTRSLFAIAEVNDPYGKGAADGQVPLAPGLFVDAEIAGKTLESVIVLPRDGLRPGNTVYIVNAEGIAESRDAIVLDLNANRAVLQSGVAVGELVILSPMEKSQINVKFKALDVDDPSIVLVEPKPDEEEEEDGEGKDGKKADKSDGKLSKKEMRAKRKAEKKAKRAEAKKKKEDAKKAEEEKKKKEGAE